MSDTIESLILDLLEWVGRKERTYQKTMDAWRTSCPRPTVWEDASDRELVEAHTNSPVCLTPAGVALIRAQRPQSEALANRVSIVFEQTGN